MSNRPVIGLSFETPAISEIEVGDVIAVCGYQDNTLDECGTLEFVVTRVVPCGPGCFSIEAQARPREGSRS